MKLQFLSYVLTGTYVLFCLSCKKDDTPDPRERFTGSYSVSDSWTLEGGGSGTEIYMIGVRKSPENLLNIIIENLGNTVAAYDERLDVKAEYFGNTFTIASQTVKVGNYSVTLSGTGSVVNDSIAIYYEIENHWKGKCNGIRQKP